MFRFATTMSACLGACILALALHLTGCSADSGGETTDSNMNANDNGTGGSGDNINENGDSSGNTNGNTNDNGSSEACSADSDCADREICTDGQCVATSGGCSVDSDCAAGEVCSAAQCVPEDTNDTITIEIYTDRSSFEARLSGSVSVVDFDDIDTSTPHIVAFESDRYQDSLGIVIMGTDGQYASDTFDFPEDYIASSQPNMYAPGPMTDDSSGGHRTVVTFTVGGESAGVAGFGAVFIDTDFPDFGPSGISVFDVNGFKLGEQEGFLGGEGEGLFRGMVAIAQDGNPTAAIHRVELINGNSWAATTSTCCEGVTLDDFVFSSPSIPPNARRGINSRDARR